MARGRHGIFSLAGGEISPELDMRSDLDRFAIGCRRIENMIVLPRGGLMKRGGSEYVAAATANAVRGRLVPFEYSTEQAYCLELGDRSMRVFKDRGRVVVAAPGGSITGGSSNFPASLGSWSAAASTAPGTASWDSTLQAMKLDPGTGVARARLTLAIGGGSVGVQHILLFKTTKRVPNANALIGAGPIAGATGTYRRIEGSGWHAIDFTPTTTSVDLEFAMNGGGTGYAAWIDDISLHQAGAFHLTTPWPAADLPRVKWVQSADTVYFFHPDHPPYKLIRYGDAAWSLSRVIWRDGPYKAANVGSVTVTPSAGTGAAVTLTASSDLFTAGMVDMPMRIKKASTDWSWGIITAYASATSVTFAVVDGDAGTVATKDWRLGRFSGDDGYPACGTFHGERLMMGGAKLDPARVLGSKIGNFETMSPSGFSGTVADDDGVDYAIVSDTVCAVLWMASLRVLLVGTTGAVFRIGNTGATSGGASKMTPTDSGGIVRESGEGAANIMPVVAGNSVLFVQREGRRITGGIIGELVYSLEVDGYAADDATTFADQLGASDFVEASWMRGRWPILWLAREDGQLAGLTYKKTQRMLAGHRHPFLNGAVESHCVIPGAAGDELWLFIRRSIGGADVRYVEVLSEPFLSTTAQADAIFVDSALVYAGAPTASLSGLGHLEGQSVRVYGDGVDLGLFSVAGGAIAALGRSVSKAVVGLRVPSIAVPMRLDLAIEGGISAGEQQQIRGVSLSLLRSRGGKVGRDEASLQRINYGQAGGGVLDDPALFTGFRYERIEGEYSDDASLMIYHDEAYPFLLRGLVPGFRASAR